MTGESFLGLVLPVRISHQEEAGVEVSLADSLMDVTSVCTISSPRAEYAKFVRTFKVDAPSSLLRMLRWDDARSIYTHRVAPYLVLHRTSGSVVLAGSTIGAGDLTEWLNVTRQTPNAAALANVEFGTAYATDDVARYRTTVIDASKVDGSPADFPPDIRIGAGISLVGPNQQPGNSATTSR